MTDNEKILIQFEQYLSQIALSPKTIMNYMADLRVFTRWAERAYGDAFVLQRVSPAQIRAYRDDYLLGEQKRAVSTINRHLQALRKCCTYLAQTHLAPSNAADEISLLNNKLEQDNHFVIPDDTLAILLRAALKTRPSIAKRDFAIMQLLANTGLRVAEIVDLSTDDVRFDFPGIHLSVRNSRDGEIRDIPLPESICGALKEWMSIRPESASYDTLFLSQEGKPMSVRTVQRIVSRCAKEEGLKGITAQVLRRTYAYNLLQKSNDIELVRQRLGHHSQAITAQYLGVKRKS